MFPKSLKRAGLAAMLFAGFGVGSANAAFLITEAAVDGSWFNTAQAGRGALVDYIPTGGNAGVVFIALYTFDSTGAPTWLTIQGNVTEGQFALTNVPAFRTTGGAFATSSPSVTGTQVGTASVTFNTCEDLRISLTLTTAGLPNLPANQPVDLVFSRGGLASAQCVYRTAFTACPTGTTAVANQPRTCLLTGNFPTANLRLPNNATYVISGKVNIGTPLLQNQAPTTSATLTIEPGTLIRGAGGTRDYLTINPGSRIFAEGTERAPIIFSGPTLTSGSWGGIVIGGLAQTNNANQPGGTAAFEADATLVWGGSNDADSSGVMRYVQIRDAGAVFDANIELNSLTLGSVGSGTTLEYIQVHNGLDDGFEFFGGTVNAKYLVVTRGNDDGLDFDVGGYRGQIQYAYVQADENADTGDGSCLESDNNAQALNAMPRAQPRVANLTCVGRAAPNFRRQLRIRRGSAGNYFNVVVANQPNGECLTVFDGATFDQITANTLTIQGSSLLGCATNFGAADATLTTSVSTWFNTAASNNQTGMLTGNLVGRIPVLGGSLDGTAVAPPTGGFFDRTTYRGAFGPTPLRDWTLGWTFPGSIRP